MIPFGSECFSKATNYKWICFWSRTQGVPLTMEFYKNCTVANIAIKAFLRV